MSSDMIMLTNNKFPFVFKSYGMDIEVTLLIQVKCSKIGQFLHRERAKLGLPQIDPEIFPMEFSKTSEFINCCTLEEFEKRTAKNSEKISFIT